MSHIVSIDDCKTIVSNYLQTDNFSVKSFKIHPHGKDVNGFLGEHLSLQIKIHYPEDEEVHKLKFFAKRFPYEQVLATEFAKSVNAFGREIALYEEVLKEFKRTIPGFEDTFIGKFCFGTYDMVVFEDLSVKGYTVAKKPNLNLLDLEHLRLVIKVLAKFHAGSILFEEIKTNECGCKQTIVDCIDVKMDEPLFVNNKELLGTQYLNASLKGLLALIDELPKNCMTNEAFKQKLEELHAHMFEIMEPQTKFRNVLCHGDLWPKNFMYKYEHDVPIDCKLVDFQLQRYCPPAHDVLTLIFLTTNKEMRQHHFHNLLRFYHNCLKEELNRHGLDIKSILSFDEFKVSVHYYLPYIKLFSAYQMSMLSTNGDYIKTLMQDKEQFKIFTYGDRSLFIKDIFREDENYKFLMSEALVELREIVSIPRVTREDCYKVMNRKLGSSYYVLDSFEVVPYSGALGFMGEYFRLNIYIHYHLKKRKFQFFVKTMPAKQSANDIATATGLFSKEVFVYEKFSQMANNMDIDLIKDCIIGCYYTRLNDIEILDDMSLQEYKTLGVAEPLTIDMLAVGLKQLAKFHATSLLIEDRMSDQLDSPYRLIDLFHDYVKDVAFNKMPSNISERFWKVGANSVETAIDLFPDIANDKLTIENFKLKADIVRDSFYSNSKPSKHFRNVLCHGDLWSTNMMYKFKNNEPVDAKIIDFQFTRYCVPGHDVLSFIYFTTRRELREKSLNYLIEIYYKELCIAVGKCGGYIEEIYPYKTFMEMIEYITPQVLIQNIIMQEFIACPSDELDKFFSIEEAIQKTYFEDRTDLIHQMCKISALYKDILKDTILDLYDYCQSDFIS